MEKMNRNTVTECLKFRDTLSYPCRICSCGFGQNWSLVPCAPGGGGAWLDAELFF